jgi:TonB family protein
MAYKSENVPEATALVEVLVDADGKVTDAWVYSPSGYQLFDDETLRVARASTYAAGTAFCKPAPGTYLFQATFKR